MSTATRIRAASRRSVPRDAAPVLVVIAALCVPLVAFVIVALRSNWILQGDEALVALRAHDVFSLHPPLVGMRTTSPLGSVDVFAHHPGPLEAYVLTIPYALSGWSAWSIVVTGALVAAFFIATAVWSGMRAASWSGAFVIAGTIAMTERVFGRELVMPLNLWPPILAMIAALALAWRLWLGHRKLAPLYVFVASYAAQAHVLFLVPVAVVTIGLLIVWALRHRRSAELQAVWKKPWRHSWVWTIVVAFLCWLPPLVDSVIQERGNFGELLKLPFAQTKGPGVGLAKASSHFASLMTPLRGAQGSMLAMSASPVQVIIAVAVLAVAAWALIAGRRRLLHGSGGGRAISVLAATVAVASIALVWTASHTIFEGQLLYLDLATPVAVLLTATALWWLLRWLLPRWSRTESFARRRGASGIVVLAIALIATAIGPPTGLNKLFEQTRSADNKLANVVVREADSILESNRATSAPLIIEPYGATAYSTLGSAIALKRVTDGQEVYFGTLWPMPQDDDFRRPSRAPFSANTLIVREHVVGQPWTLPTLPAGVIARRIQTVSLNGQPGQVELILVKP